jgi:hypothetical protein
MTDWICSTCQRIPPGFFSETNDRPGPRVGVRSLKHIQSSASQECALCTILIAHVNPARFNDASLHSLITLERSLINPSQELVLRMNGHDISYAYFFRTPSPWCMSSRH